MSKYYKDDSGLFKLMREVTMIAKYAKINSYQVEQLNKMFLKNNESVPDEFAPDETNLEDGYIKITDEEIYEGLMEEYEDNSTPTLEVMNIADMVKEWDEKVRRDDNED